jgi:hypothetical protein
MSQQETATDRLIGVIQSIQMTQGNGVLTVRRGEGSTFEEGSIIFVNGQVKQTTVGMRSGAIALNWLSTWGQCHYTFAPLNEWQMQQLNALPPAGAGNTRPITRDLQSSTPALPERGQSEPLPPASGSRWERRPLSPPSTTSNKFYPIQPLAAALREIEQNRLSRSHRQLFLLIDGQRTPQELARLTAKNEQDLQAVLRDLERIGVIRSDGL